MSEGAKSTLNQIIASSVALLALYLQNILACHWLLPGPDSLQKAGIGTLIAAFFAIAAWAGALSKKGEAGVLVGASWGVWIGIGCGSALLSVLFLLVDCNWHLPITRTGFVCDGKLNITVVYTIGVIATTAIALPSALRFWLVQYLDRKLLRAASE